MIWPVWSLLLIKDLLLEEIEDKFEKEISDIRETYRLFRDGIDADLGIASGERWENERVVDIQREDKKEAKKHLAIERHVESLFGRDGPSLHHGKAICLFDEPGDGSLIYCDLGPVEHSGIYVGNHEVVQLNGDGVIEKVSLKKFTNSIFTINPLIWIPLNAGKYKLSHIADNTITNFEASARAEQMIGQTRLYNFVLDNCHQFSSGCLSGNFENASNFLLIVKDDMAKYSNDDEPIVWACWNWVNGVLVNE